MNSQHRTMLLDREQIATSALQGLIVAYGPPATMKSLASDWRQDLAQSAVLFSNELLTALGQPGMWS
jgi:hypothetical protein